MPDYQEKDDEKQQIFEEKDTSGDVTVSESRQDSGEKSSSRQNSRTRSESLADETTAIPNIPGAQRVVTWAEPKVAVIQLSKISIISYEGSVYKYYR